MATEEQRKGIEAAKAAGKKWGGRQVGVRITVTAEKEAKIREMSAEEKSVAEIARETGLTRQTVYRILGKWERKPTAE
jgi:DNA invertase Pin-like site-specific DNA recombinase